MSELVRKPEIIVQLIDFLEQKRVEGNLWVVFDIDNPIGSQYEFTCFYEEMDAVDFAKEYQQIFNWHEAVPINDLVYQLKQLQMDWQLEHKSYETNQSDLSLKNNNIMNLNNLEDLKDEMKRLGFKDKLINEMEAYMKENVSDFRLHDIAQATKGQIEITLHFKQSGQSEFYYFNKFEVTHTQGKALQEGQKYVVITQPEEAGKHNLIKSFLNTEEAISFFKKQTSNSELAIGKGDNNKDLVASKTMVANMESGKVNYVNKEFQRTYYGNPISQTFWIEKGRGFKAEQAVNLIQGRSVYRDDLMNLAGEPYKAWVKLDFEKGKDRFQNYSTNQFHDPQYGFDLNKILDKFAIKELQDPAKRELLESSLRNGNRPLVTVEKDGQPMKLFVEAVPRYSQLNMYAENGRPEKREQFLKEPVMSATQSKDKVKEQEVEQRQGMRI